MPASVRVDANCEFAGGILVGRGAVQRVDRRAQRFQLRGSECGHGVAQSLSSRYQLE